MKALVTGASGFVGAHLVERLVNEGHTVYAMVRSTSNVEKLKTTAAHLVYNDTMHEKSSFERIFEQYPGIDTVFHLASVLPLASVTPSMYQQGNVEATKHLLEVSDANSVKAFVYCSSVGVIGPLPEIPANEESRCAPDSEYGRTKYEAELLSLRYHKEHRLPITVIRPAWIYGPGDRRTFKFFRMVARGRFAIIGNGKTRISPVYVDDVVQALLLGAQKIENAQGEVLIAAGKESVPLEFLASLVAMETGKTIPPVKVPIGLAKCAATICEAFCKRLGVEPPIHHQRLDFFLRDQAFDISKIRQTLGYIPHVDPETGIRRAIQWYKEQGWLDS